MKQKIDDTWGGDSVYSLVYSRILSGLKPDAVDYLPLSQLRELFGQGLPDPVFDQVVFWFSSDAVQVFETWYEYLEDEFDEGDISPMEVAHAMRTGQLILGSGKAVSNFREHLFPYFRGTSHLIEELRAARGSNG